MSYKVEVGEILNKDTSEKIRELLAKDTRNAVSSLRKSIVIAKDETGTNVGMSTVVETLNRYHPVTLKTGPVLEHLLKQAQALKSV